MRDLSIFVLCIGFLAKLAACQSIVMVADGADLESDSGDIGSDDTDTGSETGDTETGDTETGDTDSATDECDHGDDSILVCHDFEDGITSEQKIRDGVLIHETWKVFRGQGAMKSETFAVNSFASIADGFDPIGTGTVYFRMQVLVPAGMLVGNIKVFNLSAGGEPDVDELRGVDVNIGADRIVNIYQHGNQARFESAPDMIPEEEWFCLRGSYTISSTAGETSVWINDNLAVSTTASPDSIINGGVSETRVGIGWTELGQETAVLYFDDVLVSTVPVSCTVFNSL